MRPAAFRALVVHDLYGHAVGQESCTLRMEGPMRGVEIGEIWIDPEGRLCARLGDGSLDLTHIYRASASGVVWNAQSRAVCSPVPREWSHADWFMRMVEDVWGEYGLDLVLVESTIWRDVPAETRRCIEDARARMLLQEAREIDERKMASWVGDNRLRQEARELFRQKQWKEVVAKLEGLRYPQFMDHADIRRLEIARRRSQVE